MGPTSQDLLLEWLSERGSGNWQRFRDAYAWLGSEVKREPWETASFAARQFSALGHIEIDWSNARWSAAPPVLTILPSAGAHALLTGGRTRELSDRLRAELDGREDAYPLEPIPQELAPSAVMIASEDERAVQRLATGLGVAYSYSVSSQLAALLPPLDSYLGLARTTPAPKGYGVQALAGTDLTWVDVEDDLDPGLYRYMAPAGYTFRFFDAEERAFAVDLALGVYAELRRTAEVRRLKWFRASVNGELEVPLRASLPTLHARAATLCSGLAPQRRGRSLVYLNVPEDIAQAIARALGQSLQVVEVA